MGPTAAAITWPARYTPGETDNFVSNEVIVKGLSAAQVWPLLARIDQWESYYHNCSRITPPASGPYLKSDDTFSFSTFGLDPLPSQVTESVAPGSNAADKAGRLTWRAGPTGEGDSFIKVLHAWLVEDLDGGRVRILTQESQIGKIAADLAQQKPNPMLLGHQDWLDGLVKAARDKIASSA